MLLEYDRADISNFSLEFAARLLTSASWAFAVAFLFQLLVGMLSNFESSLLRSQRKPQKCSTSNWPFLQLFYRPFLIPSEPPDAISFVLPVSTLDHLYWRVYQTLDASIIPPPLGFCLAFTLYLCTVRFHFCVVLSLDLGRGVH